MAQEISISVIKRLPRYYRFLENLKDNGIVRISSKELAERMGLTASQIRHDFNCFGGFGQQGYGYNVPELYTKIGDYSGQVEVWHNDMGSNGKDFNASWDCVKIKQGKNSFDATFTADKSIDVAEWAFHYGGKGEHQAVDCFPNDTTLKFDNLTLECTTCGDASGEGCNFDMTKEFGVITPHSNVRLNQVGYFEKLNKIFI